MNSFIYLTCYSRHAITNMLEDSKVATALAVPITLILASPSNFLTIVLSSIKTFVIAPISVLCYLARGLYCALDFL